MPGTEVHFGGEGWTSVADTRGIFDEEQEGSGRGKDFFSLKIDLKYFLPKPDEHSGTSCSYSHSQN